MIQIIFGTAGSGKTWTVRDLISKKVRSGQSGIVLLVPEQNNYESERAMLHLLGSASAEMVEVVSFTMLARSVAGQCGTDALRPADDGVKMLMMSRAIRTVSDRLTVYSKASSSREMCASLLDFYTEMRRSSLSCDQLQATGATLSGAVSSKLSDISTVFRAYEALLSGRFSDPLDDLVNLEENLEAIGYFKGKTVVIDAFKGFTEQQYRIIDHILRQADETYVTVCSDDINSSDDLSVFANNNATATRLKRIARQNNVKILSPIFVDNDHRFNGTVIKAAEQVLRGKQPCEFSGGSITVCACSNSYDEADYVARTVRRLVRTEGYRYRDFAVIARDISDYRNLLVDAFERYKVACFSDMRVEAGSLALFRFVLSAVNCAAFNFKNDYMFPYFKSVLSQLSVEDASLLENYALLWNIRGKAWTEQWTKNPNGLDENFDRDALDRINSIRNVAVTPIEKLSSALKSGNIRTIGRGIYDFLISVGADKALASYADRFDSQSEFYMADVHRRSWEALMSCLDNCVRVFDGERCDIREFCDLFSVLLASCDIGAIPDRIDEVVIGSADRIRTGAPRITFIVGADYSVFPRPVGKGGVLTASERRRVIDAGLAVPDYERQTAVDEQFYVYSSVCSPSERLYITYHTSSLSGDKNMPSEFVGKLIKEIGSVVRTNSAQTETDRFEGVLPSVELVSTEKYRDRAAALRRQLDERDIPSGSVPFDRPDSKTASLTPENARRLFGKDIRMSASKVEKYAHCPFSFFCQFGVNAKKQASAEIDVLRRGTLVHYVLEKSVQNHGRKLSDMDRSQRMAEISALLKEYSDQTLGGYDDLDRQLLFMLDRIAIMLDHLLKRIGDEMSQCDFDPDRFELEIGGDDVEAVTVPTDDGGSVVLTGYIDRVDVYKADGRTYVRVVDYKTGSKQFDLSDIFYGLNMQMLIYLFSVVNSGIYDNAVPAGVLYMPAKRKMHSVTRDTTDEQLRGLDDKCMRMNGILLDDDSSLTAMEHDKKGRFIPYEPNNKRAVPSVADREAFSAIEKQVKDMLRSVGNSIHAGKISATPLDSKTSKACEYCDYASVCLIDNNAEHFKAESYNLKQSIMKLTGEADTDGI